jgi:hypothetical protein
LIFREWWEIPIEMYHFFAARRSPGWFLLNLWLQAGQCLGGCYGPPGGIDPTYIYDYAPASKGSIIDQNNAGRRVFCRAVVSVVPDRGLFWRWFVF